jgi:hypothetical protein
VVVESSGEREDEPRDGLADRVAVDAGAVRQDDAPLAEPVVGEAVDAGPDRVAPLVGQERVAVFERHGDTGRDGRRRAVEDQSPDR